MGNMPRPDFAKTFGTCEDVSHLARIRGSSPVIFFSVEVSTSKCPAAFTWSRTPSDLKKSCQAESSFLSVFIVSDDDFWNFTAFVGNGVYVSLCVYYFDCEISVQSVDERNA